MPVVFDGVRTGPLDRDTSRMGRAPLLPVCRFAVGLHRRRRFPHGFIASLKRSAQGGWKLIEAYDVNRQTSRAQRAAAGMKPTGDRPISSSVGRPSKLPPASLAGGCRSKYLLHRTVPVQTGPLQSTPRSLPTSQAARLISITLPECRLERTPLAAEPIRLRSASLSAANDRARSQTSVPIVRIPIISTIGHLTAQTHDGTKSIRHYAAFRRMVDSRVLLSPGLPARKPDVAPGFSPPDESRLRQKRRSPTINPTPITIPQ